MNALPNLEILRNHIDITKVPFSDRGSRLLVYQMVGAPRLNVKLAERLTSINPNIEAYLSRPPFIDDLIFINEQGRRLDFTVTSYPHVLCFKTRLGEFRLAFQDDRTLSFGLPDGSIAGISFHVSPQYWEQTDQGGMFLSVRNLTYRSNGEVFVNVIRPEQGGYRVEFVVRSDKDRAINVAIHPSATLETVGPVAQAGIADLDRFSVLPFSTILDLAQKRWETWFKRVPPVDEKYLRTYAYAWWIMGNNLVSPLGKLPYEAMMPSKVTYVGLWLWDSALHALAYRHIDPEMARNQIRTMLAYQLPNGMLPDAIYDEGLVFTIDHPVVGPVTKPPLMSWAALKLHETDPDIGFLREIYPILVRNNAWWFAMNDDDSDGLVQYTHPYSSGLDNSPLWDYGMPVESPDINTYLCLQMQSLSRMAEILGQPVESDVWRKRGAALVRRMIKDMWDEDAGLFWVLHDEEPVRVVTPFNLYPLWTGALPKSMNERLIQHLLNPGEFAGPYPIPTVAHNDSHYNPEMMWRGPVWGNINYFFVEALAKVGREDLANQLAERTLEMIAGQPDIYEYYNPDTGQAPTTAADIFGWTAAVYIDLAIRQSQQHLSGAEIESAEPADRTSAGA